MPDSLTLVALADLVGDLLMVLVAIVVLAAMWLTVELLDRV
jgi:hypothetical protein